MQFIKNFLIGLVAMVFTAIAVPLITLAIVGPVLLALHFQSDYYILIYIPLTALVFAITEEL